MLIEKVADINIENVAGYTALMWALLYGKSDIAQLLREAGAKE